MSFISISMCYLLQTTWIWLGNDHIFIFIHKWFLTSMSLLAAVKVVVHDSTCFIAFFFFIFPGTASSESKVLLNCGIFHDSQCPVERRGSEGFFEAHLPFVRLGMFVLQHVYFKCCILSLSVCLSFRRLGRWPSPFRTVIAPVCLLLKLLLCLCLWLLCPVW